MAGLVNQFVEIPFFKFVNSLLPSLPEDVEPDFSEGFDIDDSHADTLCYTFVQILNRRNVCPKYAVSHGRISVDPSHDIPDRIDGGLYLSGEAPVDQERNWSRERVSISWVSQADKDPFQNMSICSENHFDESRGFRAHLLSTAAEVFLRQQRCFHFTIVIFGRYARVVRWDRSGAVVTPKVNYREHPRMLCRFLWRYCRLTDEGQGHDPSATRIEPGTEEYELMDWAAKNGSERPCALRPWDMLDRPRPLTNDERLDYARSAFEASLSEGWSRWKLAVYEDGPDGHQTIRSFLVCKPDANNPDLFTCGTRGYIALDCETKQFVFLKDVWRVDVRHTAGRREGETLRMMASQLVRNIPTVRCHGDVLGQRTATYSFRKWARKSRKPDETTKDLFHYRLVEYEVGRPLALFEKSRDLSQILLDCLHAHEDAYTKCNLLHHDISSGNMLIVYRDDEHGDASPHGLLIDWELALPSSDGTEKHQRKKRVGTWRFISAHSQDDPHKPQTIQDDLESFFHVLLYCAIRWLPSNCPDVSAFVKDYFDAGRFSYGEYIGSALKSKGMGTGHIRVMSHGFIADLQFTSRGGKLRHPMDDITTQLLRWFGAYYSPHPIPCPRPEPANDTSSDTMIAYSDRPCFDDPDDDISEDISSDALLARRPDPIPPAQLEFERRAAAFFESHQGMCDLISKVSRRHAWPSNDRVPDRVRHPNPVVAPLSGWITTAWPCPASPAAPKPATKAHSPADGQTENTIVPTGSADVIPPAKRAPIDIKDQSRRTKRTKRTPVEAGSSAPCTAVRAASAPRAPSKGFNATDANPRPGKRARQAAPSDLPERSARPPPRQESMDASASATRRSGHMVLRSKPNPTKRFGC